MGKEISYTITNELDHFIQFCIEAEGVDERHEEFLRTLDYWLKAWQEGNPEFVRKE